MKSDTFFFSRKYLGCLPVVQTMLPAILDPILQK